MHSELQERLKEYLKELLSHYCLPGEDAEAFASWWEELLKAIEGQDKS